MMRPARWRPALDSARQYSTARFTGQKVPRRCTRITASQSSTVMFTNMRSRTMPALVTTVSRPPKVSMAASIREPAPSQSLMSSPLTMASPPLATISFTTSWAGLRSTPSPWSEAPRSFTTTLAPSAAKARAWARPRPRPAPVMTTTRPSQIPIGVVSPRCGPGGRSAFPGLLGLGGSGRQGPLVDLGHGGERQLVDQHEAVGRLVVGEVRLAPRPQLVERRGVAGVGRAPRRPRRSRPARGRRCRTRRPGRPSGGHPCSSRSRPGRCCSHRGCTSRCCGPARCRSPRSSR